LLLCKKQLRVIRNNNESDEEKIHSQRYENKRRLVEPQEIIVCYKRVCKEVGYDNTYKPSESRIVFIAEIDL
jgi:hypothetical protein